MEIVEIKPLNWKWDGNDLWHEGKSYNDPVDPHVYEAICVDDRLALSSRLERNKSLILAAPHFLCVAQKIMHHCQPEEPYKAEYIKVPAELIDELQAAIDKAFEFLTKP